MTEGTRLLIGLFPTADVQAEIQAHRQDWWWPRACSFPPQERLHLTLQSLEDQQGKAERRLRAALAEVTMRPLDIKLDSSCTWPNDISVVQPSTHEGLRRLQHDISLALRRSGFSSRLSGGWTPHITIARDSERAAGPMSLEPIHWFAREFRLVRSHFTRPFRHELLDSYPLH